jgi:hypothetical protein
MAVLSIEDLASTLLPSQAIAGLDLGTKTIGISVSDLGRRFATPREVIKRVKFGLDAQALLAMAEKERIAAFIIGLPINMDGSAGPRAQATPGFRAQHGAEDRAAVHLLGRTALDGCGRAGADRDGCFAQEAGRPD